jgi:hypothetical protein
MKRFSICLLWFILFVMRTSAQELPVPEALKTFPKSKCYWSYSVERVSAKQNSQSTYSIRVGIEQIDSTGHPSGSLKIPGVKIYCRFTDKLIARKVYCRQVGYSWIAKFTIHTSKPLPVEIVASYRGSKQIMALKLNEGTYPGENDVLDEEKLP